MFFPETDGRIKLAGQEIKLGIIGFPLGHSLSPAIHNAAMRELGVSGSYELFQIKPEELKNSLEFFKLNGFSGFNVTIPYKVDVMPFLDGIDAFAKTVGAVNTVVIDSHKKLYGYNTDVYGFISAIPKELATFIMGKKAAILGSGGAARAVVAGLLQLGVFDISIFSRNPKESSKIREIAIDAATSPGCNYGNININCFELTPYIDLSHIHMVVNTTPLGMSGNYENTSPISNESVLTIPMDGIVYDVVYKPFSTKLLQYSKKRCLKTINGIDMLLWQGIKGFELWTGMPAPASVMKQALIEQMY